jgi:hypothetical protein
MRGLRILLAGVAVGAALWATGAGLEWNAERALTAAVSSCEAGPRAHSDAWYKARDVLQAQGGGGYSNQDPDYSCAPYDVSKARYPLTAQQKAVREAFEDKHNRGEWYAMGALVAFLAALPLGWYFLLARVREIGGAFRGRD